MSDSRFPYVSDESKEEIKFENWNELYQDWTGRSHFASINYLQTAIDKVVTKKMDLQTISVSLIKKMNDLCAKEGCKFVVAILDNPVIPEFVLSLKKEGISTLEVNFDFNDTILTNLPFDMHPNAKGHRYIANKIYESIKAILKP